MSIETTIIIICLVGIIAGIIAFCYALASNRWKL